MRILFDEGTPAPLKQYLTGHEIQTVFEVGWSNCTNGGLLALAEASFDLLITTDQQIKYQQNRGSHDNELAANEIASPRDYSWHQRDYAG